MAPVSVVDQDMLRMVEYHSSFQPCESEVTGNGLTLRSVPTTRPSHLTDNDDDNNDIKYTSIDVFSTSLTAIS